MDNSQDMVCSAALAALAKSNKHYLNRSSPGSQFLFQILALLVTLAISIVGGTVVGLIVRYAKQSGSEGLKVENMYDDSGGGVLPENILSAQSDAPHLCLHRASE